MELVASFSTPRGPRTPGVKVAFEYND